MPGNKRNSIGGVEIGPFTNVETQKSRDQEEIDLIGQSTSVVAIDEEAGEEITINAVIVPESGRTVDEKREEIKTILSNADSDNSFVYMDYNGFVSVDSVDFPRSGDNSTMRNVTIKGTYLPWPEFFPDNDPSV